jgi:hypothetical protein
MGRFIRVSLGGVSLGQAKRLHVLTPPETESFARIRKAEEIERRLARFRLSRRTVGKGRTGTEGSLASTNQGRYLRRNRIRALRPLRGRREDCAPGFGGFKKKFLLKYRRPSAVTIATPARKPRFARIRSELQAIFQSSSSFLKRRTESECVTCRSF